MLNEVYQDSLFLKKEGKIKSYLLLQLCLIDGLSKKHYPKIKNNKERYVLYLKNRLEKQGFDRSYRIEEEKRIVHFSEIVYKYFRCFFVHEIDDRSNFNYGVRIEYDNPGEFWFDGLTIQDLVHKKFIVKADNLTKLLQIIIDGDLKIKP